MAVSSAKTMQPWSLQQKLAALFNAMMHIADWPTLHRRRRRRRLLGSSFRRPIAANKGIQCVLGNMLNTSMVHEIKAYDKERWRNQVAHGNWRHRVVLDPKFEPVPIVRSTTS